MRIIAGEFKRRVLQPPPPGTETRPIPDRVKESIFTLLRGHFEGAAVFDAFAGTGAIGLEAVSRGASRVVMVERDKRVAAVLRENVARLGVEDRCDVVVGDALGPGALARCPDPVHIVFFDPPYALVRDEAGWRRVRTQFERLVQRLDPSGFAVLRTPWPFTHEINVPRGPTGEGAKGAREVVIRAESPDDASLDARLEAFEAELGIIDHGRPRHVDVPLELDSAEGPETHAYRHTACHLYMRRPSGPG